MTKEYFAKLEALLFAAGKPLPLDELAVACQLDQSTCQAILNDYSNHLYHNQYSALCLKRVENRYVLSLKTELHELISSFYKNVQAIRMTPASYETLAAVLYNQPVTRAQVEAVRGVNSDSIMARLEENGLIEECGVLEQPGRPTIFKVTDRCMLELGIESVEELKPTELLMYETIRALEEGEE